MRQLASPILQYQRHPEFQKALICFVLDHALRATPAYGAVRSPSKRLDILPETSSARSQELKLQAFNAAANLFCLRIQRKKFAGIIDHLAGETELFVLDSVLSRPLALSINASLLVSEHNPGAAELAAELQKLIGRANRESHANERKQLTIKNASKALRPLKRQESKEFVEKAIHATRPRGIVRGIGPDRQHFMLLLNGETFVGEPGEQLAQQVQAHMYAAQPLLLVHECDTLAFGHFLEITPRDLLVAGIYRDIATPLFTSEPLRAVSLALLGQKLGATPVKKGPLRQRARDLGNSMLRPFERRSAAAEGSVGDMRSAAASGGGRC